MTTRSSHNCLNTPDSFYPLRASYTFATDSSPYHIPIARAAELPHSGLRRIDNFQTIDEANQDRSGVGKSVSHASFRHFLSKRICNFAVGWGISDLMDL